MEGEALRLIILLQLMHQLYLAVRLDNVARHPTSGIGEPVDRHAGLIVSLEHTRVVDQDRFELAVSRQVSPQQEGEKVLKCLEARADISSFKMYKRSGIFFHCRPVSSN